MSTARLTEILKTLNTNGFKACIFALKDGLPLASQKDEGINEKIVAAMGAMLSDTGERAKQDLGLSDMVSIKIIYKDAGILCRNIQAGDTYYLLAGLINKPDTPEMEKYLEDLFEWAVENSLPVLQKLGSL
ncbi:MAG: roadblock/LC7 domain-containing protein [archaeon]|nr:roadblock/LC7 domain-containing protein [archaeon]